MNATSATTRPDRSLRRSATGLRPPSFRVSAGASCTSCQAGSTPASRPEMRHTPAVNNMIGRLKTIDPSGRTAAGICVASSRAPHQAMSTPSAPPAQASTVASTITCRISLARPAPIAARSAISRRRPAARARSRFVTLMQAISRMKATAAIRTSSVPAHRLDHFRRERRDVRSVAAAHVHVLGFEVAADLIHLGPGALHRHARFQPGIHLQEVRRARRRVRP